MSTNTNLNSISLSELYSSPQPGQHRVPVKKVLVETPFVSDVDVEREMARARLEAREQHKATANLVAQLAASEARAEQRRAEAERAARVLEERAAYIAELEQRRADAESAALSHAARVAELQAALEQRNRPTTGGKTITGYKRALDAVESERDDESESESESDAPPPMRSSVGGKTVVNCYQSYADQTESDVESESEADSDSESESDSDSDSEPVALQPMKRVCVSAAESPKYPLIFQDNFTDFHNITDAPVVAELTAEAAAELTAEAAAEPAAEPMHEEAEPVRNDADSQRMREIADEYDDDSAMMRFAKKLYASGMPMSEAAPQRTVDLVARIFLPSADKALKLMMKNNGVEVVTTDAPSRNTRQEAEYSTQVRIVITDSNEAGTGPHIGDGLLNRVFVNLVTAGHPIMTLRRFMEELASFNRDMNVYASGATRDLRTMFFDRLKGMPNALYRWAVAPTPAMFPVSYYSVGDANEKKLMQRTCEFLVRARDGASLVDLSRRPGSALSIDALYELVLSQFVAC